MDTPHTEQLLKNIQELEAEHARLKEEISKFMLHGIIDPGTELGNGNQKSHSISPQCSRLDDPRRSDGGGQYGLSGQSSTSQRESGSGDPVSCRREVGSPVVNFTNKQYLNILQSLGQSVHIFDSNGRIIFWNRMAEHLYGYAASEVLGRHYEFLLESCNVNASKEMLNKNIMGNNWTGQFPVLNKRGERFVIVATNTPFYDDIGNLVGVICVSDDAQRYIEALFPSSGRNPSEAYPRSCQPRSGPTTKSGFRSQQDMQVGIASKISNLAFRMTNKVWSNIRTGRKYASKSFPDYGGEGEGNKIGIHKVITSRTEPSMSKKGIPSPWKGSEHDISIVRTIHDGENDFGQLKSSDINPAELEFQVQEINRFGNEDFGSQSSFSSNVNSSSTIDSSSSSISSVISNRFGSEDFLDILWEDLTIGERIGQGSCGFVYHGLWRGLDVALKVFSKLDYSAELLHTFRQEVSLMKRLRHPNVLLFMGAVTSPQHLCIVTELLTCGSLFQLLRLNTPRLDWRQRVLMALDVAQGINYLHHCNPPIIHRDLKSSNLLVDKNLNVKVGDFGLSRLKHHTYLTTRTWKGTAQWMAPEVLRDERSDEKSDVYSYGVILWELATLKIPWDNLNPVQVIGAVGFMNKRIEIPNDMDPQWASIINSCWHSEPNCRPTFEELLVKLKDILRQYNGVKPKQPV